MHPWLHVLTANCTCSKMQYKSSPASHWKTGNYKENALLHSPQKNVGLDSKGHHSKKGHFKKIKRHKTTKLCKNYKIMQVTIQLKWEKKTHENFKRLTNSRVRKKSIYLLTARHAFIFFCNIFGFILWSSSNTWKFYIF